MPPMAHRYLAPASAYGFAGEKLTLWDQTMGYTQPNMTSPSKRLWTLSTKVSHDTCTRCDMATLRSMSGKPSRSGMNLEVPSAAT